MKLVNGLSGVSVPAVPASLKDRLFVATLCELSEQELFLFTQAFVVLDMELKKHPSPVPGWFTTVVFLNASRVSVELDEDQLGAYTTMIFIPMDKIRSRNASHLLISQIIFEELAHCFWFIRDEHLVQDKVLDLLRYIYPAVRKSDVYNPNWTEHD